MKVCGLLLLRVMRAAAGGMHGSELRAEPYFLSHENVPSASVVPVLFGTAQEKTTQSDRQSHPSWVYLL